MGLKDFRRGGRLATLPGPLRPSRGREAAAVRPAELQPACDNHEPGIVHKDQWEQEPTNAPRTALDRG